MHSESDNFFSTRDLDRLRAKLNLWAGSQAVIIGLTFSFRQLELELWKPGAPTRLTIVCLGPTYFAGPLQWTEARMRVDPLPPLAGIPGSEMYDVVDAEAGVRVRCDAVQALEQPARSWQAGMTGSSAPPLPPGEGGSEGAG